MDGGRNTPGGYRSGVAFDRASRVWIAVGTNGADVSRDDGKTWSPFIEGDTAKDWNAVALPYLVGGKGKIGRIAEPAKKPTQ